MSFHAFSQIDFFSYSQQRLASMRQQILAEPADYLLGVNEEEYVAHATSEFQIEPLVFMFDALEVTPSEKLIRAEMHPPTFSTRRGAAYPRQVFQFHLPLSGESDLLGVVPTTHIMDYPAVDVGVNSISFTVIDFYSDGNRVSVEKQRVLNTLRQQSENLARDVEQFNAGLREEARKTFSERKSQLLKQADVVTKVGVPVRKARNVPQTFAVPAPAIRKKVVPRPAASASGPPEPTVDEEVYEHILRVIHDTGVGFERLPSTYADRDEETLRDHIILILEPHFEGSTTGETFNKAGKTDILMRYQGKNVFVAECKFWHGEKKHLDTIDQVLSYLTWRDSKAAIVYFVQTKEMVAPLKAITESTATHACYVSTEQQREESWFRYKFHLPGDPSRPVHLSILCFHFPPLKKADS